MIPGPKSKKSGMSLILKVIILIPVLILALIGLFAIPFIVDYVNEYGVPELPSEEPPVDTRPPDMQKYYQLKNLSCDILSQDFLLQTHDVSKGSLTGLFTISPDEQDIAEDILAGYESDQTTKTYVKDTWMKKVILTPSSNHTSIWKEGRVYQCNPGCTMNLLGDEGWQEHLDTLERIRTNCAEFGKTAMPEHIDMTRLITIERIGREDFGSFRCERFQITPDKEYAEFLLSSEVEDFDNDQRALLWGLAHLDGPMEECLDDGVGLIVWRNLTLDLTESYLFDYTEDGGMFVNQYTELEYYDSSVPDSFFTLPN